MTRSLIAVTLVAAFLCATSARAEMKYFPLWTEKQCDGETLGCYTFDQMKSIIKADLGLQLRMKELDLSKRSVVELNLAIDKMAEANAVLGKSIALLEERMREKNDALDDIAMRAVKSYDRDILGGALPWAVMISLAAFAGGILVGVYVRR